ncbi:MAG: malate synthase A [Calditrichia bacterium]
MSKSINTPSGVEIHGTIHQAFEEILTPDALSFIAKLHRNFNPKRKELLQARADRQTRIDAGELPDFLAATSHIREDASWQVAPIPEDLQRRTVEITGPVDRKMVINALNSGADVFMADFEDANSPTWENQVSGQINLRDAINGTISFTNAKGKEYALNENISLLLVRPRGWHLYDKHITIDGEPISGSLMDFGLYFFHNAKTLLGKGSGPYFYLPKLESHLEGRLWNDVFNLAQDEMGINRGSIKVTVLLENILLSFEIEELLYELKDHIAGINAGRWDYIFSVIKKFRNQPGFLIPDRGQVTMQAPFMRAYTDLLVQTCHKRGAHAIGGMAAFIPSRRDEEVNRVAFEKVRADKVREANDGFEGTWVAHPDLVAVAREEMKRVLGERPHQKDVMREDVNVSAADLMNFTIPGGKITENGLRHNINVAIQYIESWLRGVGAAGIYNLMEDAATAEISRAQIWNWVYSPNGILDDGREVTLELFRSMVPEEQAKIKAMWGDALYGKGKFALAASILDDLVSDKSFIDFLTLPAYKHL